MYTLPPSEDTAFGVQQKWNTSLDAMTPHVVNELLTLSHVVNVHVVVASPIIDGGMVTPVLHHNVLSLSYHDRHRLALSIMNHGICVRVCMSLTFDI